MLLLSLEWTSRLPGTWVATCSTEPRTVRRASGVNPWSRSLAYLIRACQAVGWWWTTSGASYFDLSFRLCATYVDDLFASVSSTRKDSSSWISLFAMLKKEFYMFSAYFSCTILVSLACRAISFRHDLLCKWNESRWDIRLGPESYALKGPVSSRPHYDPAQIVIN